MINETGIPFELYCLQPRSQGIRSIACIILLINVQMN